MSLEEVSTSFRRKVNVNRENVGLYNSDKLKGAGIFSEDEAQNFFQQLISGVSYCHSMQVSHGDLNLANIMLDGSPARRL
ncbi:hypothetical protein ACET3Z_001682 [Daucus carota]